MKLRVKIVTAISLALLLSGVGAMSASAAGVWRSVPVYVQEKSNWCWVASAKSIINYHKGTTPAQCTVYKWAKGGTTCPNQTGTLVGIQGALSHAGFSNSGNYSSSTLSWSATQSQIAVAKPFVIRWGWNSTGGASGHTVAVRGYNTTGSIVSYVDPLKSTYQNNTYSWMVSGGGHTWSHTLAGITS